MTSSLVLGALAGGLSRLPFAALSPSPEFLTYTLAFETTIIAIAIPLSLDIVSRISELYESEIISRKFSQERAIKWLPAMLMANIVLIVTLRFFGTSGALSHAWTAFTWVVFAFFLVIAAGLFRFYILLKRYTTDTTYILNKLFREAEIAATEGMSTDESTDFAQSIEGITEVLVFEAKRRNKNARVIASLGRLEEIIKGLLESGAKVHGGAPAARPQGALELRGMAAAKSAGLSGPLADNSFSTAIDQLLRIHGAAMKADNLEISGCSTNLVTALLDDIARKPEMDMFVEQLLTTLTDVGKAALERRDDVGFTTLSQWYVDIVFSVSAREGSFDLTYLEAFDRHFFTSLKYLIERDRPEMFEVLLNSVIYRVSIPRYSSADLWVFTESYRGPREGEKAKLGPKEIEEQVLKMEGLENSLFTMASLEQWNDEMRALRVMLEQGRRLIPGSDSDDLRAKLESAAATRYKYDNLLEVLFAVCAYCLLRRRPEFVRTVWETGEPLNTDARQVLRDIIPPDFDSVAALYCRTALFGRRFGFGRSGVEAAEALRSYFLLLMTRASLVGGGRASPVWSRSKAALVEAAKDGAFEMETLVGLARSLAGRADLLASFGLEPGESSDALLFKVSPYLISLRGDAEDRRPAENPG